LLYRELFYEVMDSKKLEKFYRGECSPQEAEEVLAWFKEEELKPAQEQDLYGIWQEAEKEEYGQEFTPDTAGRILAGLSRAIDEREEGRLGSQPSGEERGGHFTQAPQWRWALKAAAAILLPVCFLWLFMRHSSEGGGVPVPRTVMVEACAGTRETISLEDGSRITLNTGGRVTYQEPFPSHGREITLSGEAFFVVAKDSLRPFVVRTGPLSTQALGTSFNISHRPGERGIAVALATGAVQIEKRAEGVSGGQLARLEPGQRLVYDWPDHSYRVEDYDPMEVLGWREGILYFNRAKLDQVIERLERWYGIDIQITGRGPDEEKEWFYTGTFDNQSLEHVLEGISFVKRFSYERRGNKVILEFD
jgi:ferric-dicitrate binding protein FerR (iron transport regulator)